MIRRGEVHWADLGEPRGSRPAKRRPVLVVSADAYNDSRLATVVVAVITSNTALAAAPGNVFLPAATSGLPRDSVVNVTALTTVDKRDLEGRISELPRDLLEHVSAGLGRVLGFATAARR